MLMIRFETQISFNALGLVTHLQDRGNSIEALHLSDTTKCEDQCDAIMHIESFAGLTPLTIGICVANVA